LEKKIRDRKERHCMQCQKALQEFDQWLGATVIKA